MDWQLGHGAVSYVQVHCVMVSRDKVWQMRLVREGRGNVRFRKVRCVLVRLGEHGLVW